MTNIEISKIINNIESKFDVNSLVYKGLLIWPILKTSIYAKSLHNKTNFQKNKLHSLFTLKNIFKKRKYLILSPGNKRIVKDGKLYNRLANAFFDNLNIDDYLLVEHNFMFDYLRETHYNNKNYINLSFLSLIFKYMKKRYVKKIEVENFQTLVDSIEKKNLLTGTYTMIASILIYKIFYKLLLKYQKPEVIFIINYYNIHSFAMIKAASELNITTVDIQHGIQNNYQPMYSTWSAIPKDGYELLPKVFWVWSSYNKSRLNTWLKGNTYHNVINGTNISILDNIEKFSLKKNKGIGHNILIATQLNEPLTNWLIKSIKQNSRIQWIIREHPVYKVDNAMKKTINSIDNISFSKTDCLYDELLCVDVVVTSYSTVGFEANMLNIPVVFTSLTAPKRFGEFEEEYNIFYICNENDFQFFLDKIDKYKNMDNKKVIESNKEKALVAFNNILSKKYTGRLD